MKFNYLWALIWLIPTLSATLILLYLISFTSNTYVSIFWMLCIIGMWTPLMAIFENNNTKEVVMIWSLVFSTMTCTFSISRENHISSPYTGGLLIINISIQTLIKDISYIISLKKPKKKVFRLSSNILEEEYESTLEQVIIMMSNYRKNNNIVNTKSIKEFFHQDILPLVFDLTHLKIYNKIRVMDKEKYKEEEKEIINEIMEQFKNNFGTVKNGSIKNSASKP